MSTTCFRQKARWKKINRKITALTLLLITTFAVVIGGFIVTTRASETNSTTSDTSTVAATDLNSNATGFSFWGMGSMMMGDGGFGGGHRGQGSGFMEGMGSIEVSSEYTANVNAILNNDTDVQSLISQGYNVTSINPIIKNIIQADGTLTTKATTAIVTLQNGTSGYATASVDVEQAKVTQIVTITRTVIDKTTS